MTKTSMLAVRMPADLAERIRRLAEKNDRTVKAEIRAALREHVEREDAAHGGGSRPAAG